LKTVGKLVGLSFPDFNKFIRAESVRIPQLCRVRNGFRGHEKNVETTARVRLKRSPRGSNELISEPENVRGLLLPPGTGGCLVPEPFGSGWRPSRHPAPASAPKGNAMNFFEHFANRISLNQNFSFHFRCQGIPGEFNRGQTDGTSTGDQPATLTCKSARKLPSTCTNHYQVTQDGLLSSCPSWVTQLPLSHQNQLNEKTLLNLKRTEIIIST